MPVHPKSGLILLVTLPVACATSGGAGSDALLEQQRVDIEDVAKELRFELQRIRDELAALKATQAELSDTHRTLAAKLEGLDSGRPSPPPRPRRPDPEVVYAFPVGDSPVRGPKQAWVTVVEVSDFQCPYCRRVTPTLSRLLEEYGDDLRWVFKHNPLPFHNRAMPASLASECARVQGKFWPMHDLLFQNNQALDDTDLQKYARQAGLDMSKFEDCYGQKEFQKRVESDQQTATELGARGTPAFFINGRYLAGAQPITSFQKVIDAELKKAKTSGIPQRHYYERVVVAKGRKEM